MPFLLQFRGELRKLFKRKRTHLGFLAFALVAVVMPLLFELPAVRHSFRVLIEERGRSFDEYFSALTIAFIVLRATTFLVGALYVAMVAGDIVSKEVEDGTMRMLLSRPVSRFRLLALKYLVTLFYTGVLVLFIGLAALGASFIYGKPGGFFVSGMLEHVVAFHDFPTGLRRYLMILPMFVLSLMTINATAFFLSCCKIKPAAATISTLTIFFVDYVFRSLPYFESLESYFISTRLTTWIHTLEIDIPWQTIGEDYLWLLAADATLFVLGWIVFEWRDFKA